MDIVISKSNRKDKTIKAVIDNKKTIHFGASGYSDYTKHKDSARKMPIFSVIKGTRTGQIIKLLAFAQNTYYGINQVFKNQLMI